MRRLLAIGAAAAVAIGGLTAALSPSSSPSQHVWVVKPATRAPRTMSICLSADCGPYAASLHWNLSPWGHTTTGYYVYLNGTQEDDVAQSPWIIPGGDCGTTVTLGVQQHDAATPTPDTGPMYTTTYATPACAGHTANIWVNTTAGTCARSATATAYNAATACGSFQAAAAICSAGDDIRVVGGPYSSQTITAAKTSPGCTIESDGGAASPVTINGSIAGSGTWMTYKNFDLVGGTIGASRIAGQPTWPTNQTYDNINIDGQGGCSDIFWASGQNLTWNGGSLHDSYCNNNGNQIEGEPNPASNFTIENVVFTNEGRNATCVTNGCHHETLRVDDGLTGALIQDNTFGDMSVLCSGCGAPNSALLFGGSSTGGGTNGHYQNVSVIGNYFSGQAANAIDVQLGCTNTTIAYNTHVGQINTLQVCADGPSGYGTSEAVSSNVGYVAAAGCAPGSYVTFDHNIWTANSITNCGGTDSLHTSGVFAADGKHLASGSPAIQEGNRTYCTMPADIDGVARPTAPTNCDAGAWQFVP